LEVREIYATVPLDNYHCVLLDNVIDKKAITAAEGTCEQWIYDRDQNYESITTEVCLN